jgi:hypothetical protein
VPLEIHLRERECAFALVKPMTGPCERSYEHFGSITSNKMTHHKKFGSLLRHQTACISSLLEPSFAMGPKFVALLVPAQPYLRTAQYER